MVKEMPINEKDKKAVVVCKNLTWNECPYCGSSIRRYEKSKINEWDEDLYFECGLHIKSQTPIIMEIYTICKKSKEYMNLKEQRLKEYKLLEKFINENIKERRLLDDLIDRMGSVRSNIVTWWSM